MQPDAGDMASSVPSQKEKGKQFANVTDVFLESGASCIIASVSYTPTGTRKSEMYSKSGWKWGHPGQRVTS
jgi:hypothetical protein